MNQKFILLLVLLASLVSCREANELLENDKVSTNNFVDLQNRAEKRSSNPKDFSVTKDSITSSVEGEEKPPIKNGEHWKP